MAQQKTGKLTALSGLLYVMYAAVMGGGKAYQGMAQVAGSGLT